MDGEAAFFPFSPCGRRWHGRSPCRMRGNGLSMDQTPHRSAMLRIASTLSHKGRGATSASASMMHSNEITPREPLMSLQLYLTFAADQYRGPTGNREEINAACSPRGNAPSDQLTPDGRLPGTAAPTLDTRGEER